MLNEHRKSPRPLDEHAYILAHTFLNISEDTVRACANRLAGKYLLHRHSYPDRHVTTSWLEISEWRPEQKLPVFMRRHITTDPMTENRHNGFIIPKRRRLFFLGATSPWDIHLMIAFDQDVHQPPFLQGILLAPALDQLHHPFAAKVYCERLPDDARHEDYRAKTCARKLEESQPDIEAIAELIDNRTASHSVLKFTKRQLKQGPKTERS